MQEVLKKEKESYGPMKITVIINSYNYAHYIGQTIESVLAQVLPADEIIIVDDGSTDQSLEIIEGYARRFEQIKVLCKRNGGQLSAFNAASRDVSGDVIFFVDSDDLWRPEYLQKIMAIYRERPVDYVFCAFEEFDQSQRIVKKYAKDTDLGFSAAFTYFKKVYIGGPTATLSLRRSLFDRIFPVPFEEAWRVCADLPLVMGASLAGGHKYYCADPLVLYRIHKINAHKVLETVSDYDYRFTYNRAVLVNYFAEKFSLSESVCGGLIANEVRVCRGDMRFGLLWRYMTIIFKTERAVVWKLENFSATLKSYFQRT